MTPSDALMSHCIGAAAALAIQAAFASAVLAQAAADVSQGGGGPPSASSHQATALRAQPTAGSISVDGRLDESTWASGDAIGDFLQVEPNEGTPASQRTEVRVAFSRAGVYVGAHLFDDDPARILETLGRRDDLNQADWFLVSLDSDLDRKTAY